MLSIGILHGKEGTFPYDLFSYLEEFAPKDINVSEVTIGALESSYHFFYDVIIDRISHCIPFYREVMRHAVLTGTYVINNPFRANPEKFFANSVALKLGVNVPKTFIIPNKNWPGFLTSADLENLEYPLDWENIVKQLGFPLVLKPVFGGGWRDVFVINSLEELFYHYDQSGSKLMMLQEFIDYSDYIRVFVIGKKYVKLTIFNPLHKKDPSILAYPDVEPDISDSMKKYIEDKSIVLCKALDYDVNSLEWAIREDRAYAIDFCNQVPDARQSVINAENYKWLISHIAELAIFYAQNKPEFNWWSSLNTALFHSKNKM